VSIQICTSKTTSQNIQTIKILIYFLLADLHLRYIETNDLKSFMPQLLLKCLDFIEVLTYYNLFNSPFFEQDLSKLVSEMLSLS